MEIVCPECMGDGKCSHCSGTGEDPSFSNAFINMGGHSDPCPECYGSGDCEACDGTGFVDEKDAKSIW